MRSKIGFSVLALMMALLPGCASDKPLRRKRASMIAMDDLVDGNSDARGRALKKGKKSSKSSKSSKKSSKKSFELRDAMLFDFSTFDVLSLSMSMSMPSPDTPPTSSPLAACQALSREEALESVLVEITDGPTLTNPITPQSAAFRWLLNDDPLQIDPCDYPTVEQRYSLSTLYFSTGGDSWFNNTGWLDISGECDWFGITCEDGLTTVISLGKWLWMVEIPCSIRDDVAHISHSNFLFLQRVTDLLANCPPKSACWVLSTRFRCSAMVW